MWACWYCNELDGSAGQIQRQQKKGTAGTTQSYSVFLLSLTLTRTTTKYKLINSPSFIHLLLGSRSGRFDAFR